MTESYDPYANAIAEKINGILKQEFLLKECNTDIETMKHLVKVQQTPITRKDLIGHVI